MDEYPVLATLGHENAECGGGPRYWVVYGGAEHRNAPSLHPRHVFVTADKDGHEIVTHALEDYEAHLKEMGFGSCDHLRWGQCTHVLREAIAAEDDTIAEVAAGFLLDPAAVARLNQLARACWRVSTGARSLARERGSCCRPHGLPPQRAVQPQPAPGASALAPTF